MCVGWLSAVLALGCLLVEIQQCLLWRKKWGRFYENYHCRDGETQTNSEWIIESENYTASQPTHK